MGFELMTSAIPVQRSTNWANKPTGWNKAWKKIQARTGFEPMTSTIPVRRSTNWANKSTGSWWLCWIQINLPSGE